MARSRSGSGGIIGAVVVLAAAAGAGYYLITKQQSSSGGGGGGGGKYHGHLSISTGSGQLSDKQVNIPPNQGGVQFDVTGLTPGAEVIIYYSVNQPPTDGQAIGGTGTVQSDGHAYVGGQIEPGAVVYVGASFWAIAYDTSVGTVAGYSNPVKINIVSP